MQTHEEVVLGQEGRPRRVYQGGVGLARVRDDLPRAPVPIDKLDHVPVEVQAHHRGLAALLRDAHLGDAVRRQELGDVGRQQRLGHPERAARVELLLGQEGSRSSSRNPGCRSHQSASRARGTRPVPHALEARGRAPGGPPRAAPPHPVSSSESMPGPLCSTSLRGSKMEVSVFHCRSRPAGGFA